MRAKILIVDDDRDILLGLENRITWMGHEPVTADNGEVALRLLEQGEFDLVLLDLELPVLSGLEILERVRGAPRSERRTEEDTSAPYSTPLIIILTAFGTIERAVQAKTPAEPGLTARVRQHRVARRDADPPACPLGDDQDNRKLPAAGQRKERHGQEIDAIANNRDWPIAAGTIAEIARDKPQCVAEELAKSRDKADDRGARSEDAKVRAGDAARAFIGHVGE